MAEYTIVREVWADGPYYSFLVDGTPSLKWFRECNVEGQAKTYYVDRCIERLKKGRSREAFGPAPEVAIGGVPLRAESDDQSAKALEAMKAAGVPEALAKQAVEQLRKLSGKGRGRVWSEEGKAPPEGKTNSGKPRAARPVWRYSLDGKQSEKTYPTEAAAREACATSAFMTRGKLGRLDEVRQALKEAFPHAKEHKVWACKGEHCIRAKVDGVEYLIDWGATPLRFKAKPTTTTTTTTK